MEYLFFSGGKLSIDWFNSLWHIGFGHVLFGKFLTFQRRARGNRFAMQTRELEFHGAESELLKRYGLEYCKGGTKKTGIFLLVRCMVSALN